MSLDTQVALARPPRGESSHLSRAARQVVPPFLQKLYEIVNDPANEELIKWSDNGDSFYVLNHEKFAREVLGRWFKHQKFASFVRQLNMYGFHKIPHLQQGVLKSDSDTEPWHFEHPNFHRGQPDLLCLIQRKKQPPHGQPEDATIAIEMHDATNTPNPLANVTPGQHLLDINSIVTGVAAIKRHQQAISSDLSVLKQNNDALWKEAIASRQRHAKHQDTINRILKFLAGVFGHTEGAAHSPDGSHTPPQVTPRIRQRLMIGDGRSSSKGRPVDMMEVEDDEGDLLRSNGSQSPFPSATIETPEASISSPSITASEAFTPTTEVPPSSIRSPPLLPSQILSRSSTPRLTNGTPTETIETPPATSMPSQNAVDAVWQAAIQHMINSPGQLQRIMQAFASQQPIPSLNPPPSDPPPLSMNNSAVAPYDSNQDYSRWLNTPSASSAAVLPSLPASVPIPAPVPALAPTQTDDNPGLQLLLDESSRLQKSYRDAAEIDADMDMLQSSINSLIQNLGIDPTSIATPAEEPVPAPPPTTINGNGLNGTSMGLNGTGLNGTGLNGHAFVPDSFSGALNGLGPLDSGMGMGGDPSQPDYLLDSLLSQIGPSADGGGAGIGIGGGGGVGGGSYPDVTDHYDHSARIDGTAIEDASTEQLAAFLDRAEGGAGAGAGGESPKVGMAGIGTGNGVGGGGGGAGQAHQKRKSEVAELELELPLPTSPDGTGRKVKRKR